MIILTMRFQLMRRLLTTFLRSFVIRWFDVDIDHNSRRTIFLTYVPSGLLEWDINLKRDSTREL